MTSPIRKIEVTAPEPTPVRGRNPEASFPIRDSIAAILVILGATSVTVGCSLRWGLPIGLVVLGAMGVTIGIILGFSSD